MLPQNILITPPSTQIPSSRAASLPSRDVLEELASLEKDARRIKERGGPGRLTFEEIEELVKKDTTRELRGLVVSWLEWASF